MCRPQVLVIERSANLRLLYVEELREAGYNVASCAEPAQAAYLADGSTVALVLADGGCSLPDAARAARQVRRLFPDAAVVVQTTSAHCVRGMLPTAADALLLKSSDLTELKHTTAELVPRGHTWDPDGRATSLVTL